jgi:hypothetical protein
MHRRGENMVEHKLHLAVGNLIDDAIKITGVEVVRDSACGGKQHIPLFLGEKGRGNVLTNVDLMILKDGKIKVIVEIEESDLAPLHICGKFLAPLLCETYIHSTKGNEKIGMDKAVMLIQILNNFKLSEGTKKEEQGKNLEKAIIKFITDEKFPIKRYKIIYGSVDSFTNGNTGNELIQEIKDFLGKKI